MALTQQEVDRRWGRHSGIPTCCVEAFVAGTAVPGPGYRLCPGHAQAQREGTLRPALIHRCTLPRCEQALLHLELDEVLVWMMTQKNRALVDAE